LPPLVPPLTLYPRANSSDNLSFFSNLTLLGYFVQSGERKLCISQPQQDIQCDQRLLMQLFLIQQI
jgi:hypothetical protein